MQIEKLNKNKIRVIFNNIDLINNNMDYHTFMADPKKLYIKLLNTLENEMGFKTSNYNIKIETVKIKDDSFILTITRYLHTKKKSSKVAIKNNESEIYLFDNFDDLCAYLTFIKNNKINLDKISKSIKLYKYNNNFYLVFNNIKYNTDNKKEDKLKRKVFNTIIEYATFIEEAKLLPYILQEKGILIN